MNAQVEHLQEQLEMAESERETYREELAIWRDEAIAAVKHANAIQRKLWVMALLTIGFGATLCWMAYQPQLKWDRAGLSIITHNPFCSLTVTWPLKVTFYREP